MKKFLAALSLLAAVSACEPPTRNIEADQGPVSGPIALSLDDKKLIVAAEDHDQVLVIDRSTRAVVARISVADAPSHLVLDSRGRAIVTSRYGHSVSVVNVDAGQVERTFIVGSEPVGLVQVEGSRFAVALAGEAALAIIDIDQGTVERKFALPDLDPRAVALLADGSVYVSHMATGNFSRVDPTDGSVRLVDVRTRNDFGAALQAEHLRSLTLDPKDGHVLVAHSQANSDTVRAPIGDPLEDPFQNPGCGYSGCPTELGAVIPGVTEVDPDTNTVVVPAFDVDQGGLPNGIATDAERAPAMDCFDCGADFVSAAAPPSVLNPFDGRFAGVQISNPVALALIDGGRGQVVVNLGSKNALILRRNLKGNAADAVGFVRLGNGAQSIALSHDGEKAYVWNQFDGTISEFDVPSLERVEAKTRFVPDASGEPIAAELGVVPELAADTFEIVEDALAVEASVGRKMFHDATDARIASGGAVSCASCHPDGRTDGRTWQFVFGPRNTPQLGGGILDTAPFHWPGDVPTVPALNDMTVLPFMGGSGLDAGSFQYVAAFIDTIRAAPSAAELAGLTQAQARGKAIFDSAETGCTACHSGAHFTDNGSYDIGSKADDRDITSFQTPVLHGLNRSAPYFHDGRYKTLEDVVRQNVAQNLMGTGSHLTNAQQDDLIEYLKTL